MLTAARAAWARLDFAGLRAALSTPWEALPRAARRPLDGPVAEGLRRIEGPVAANPMSGALFLGGRRLAPPPPGAGGEPRPTDWIVQTFPSRLRYPAIAPIWYGERADLAAILTEALPRALMLDRDPEAAGAVALVGLPLARLDRMQEMLNAGVFAPRAVKAHAWDKVISAPRAWRPEAAPAAAELREGARRVREAFAGGARDVGPPVVLLPSVDGEAARALRAAAGRTGALALDPDATPLSRLVPALAAAPRILAADGRALAAALLASPGAAAALPAGGEAPISVASAMEIPPEILPHGATEPWLASGAVFVSR
ncbi:hypothetical protein P2H44_18430 [Albimonas sp. CAU 1670]|nr:hypothetical protein [Albimonas sp. CAU 1670]